jgi:hypothetical protein
MSWNTTKHHYILPRSLCITILPPFSRNCGFICLEIPISVVIWERNDAIPRSGFTISVGFGCTLLLCLRSFKASFSFTCLEGWSWRSEDFSFGAVPIGWRMEKHRARWSLPRWLLACLRLYVSTDEIFCISFKDIQTTKVQTFTSLRPSCHKLSILPPTNVTSHTTCITIALPHPPHHTPPHLRQYHPTRTYMQ